MGEQFDAYVKTIANENTRNLLETSYRAIGNYDDSAKTFEDVKSIFLITKVDTPQSARNLCSQFRNYARSIGDQNLLRNLEQIDFLEISLRVRELGVAKYFSNKKFEATFHSIGNSSILNPFYVQTLFLCIYEGVYSRDFTVLMNLRVSDIHGNIVTCRPEKGAAYDIEVSDTLVNNLRVLGTTYIWKCRNGHREFPRDISGEHPDSCFKVENPRARENRRSPLGDRYKNTYRKRLREIVSIELGYNVFGFEIYVSGIMHRIALRLASHGFTVCYAFAKNNRDKVVKQIIQSELKRSNYKGSASQFKQLVEGHLEIFELPSMMSTSLVRTFVVPNQKRFVDEAIQDVLLYADIEPDNSEDSSNVTTGTKVPKKDLISLGERFIYPRSRAIARAALAFANYHCEIDEEHPTFISKRYEKPYTEPHHLVPIAFSDNFDVSLDVPENIVSLCSHCHNKIHYGKEITNTLRWLYESRKTQLENVGIRITFEELLLMYNIEK